MHGTDARAPLSRGDQQPGLEHELVWGIGGRFAGEPGEAFPPAGGQLLSLSPAAGRARAGLTWLTSINVLVACSRLWLIPPGGPLPPYYSQPQVIEAGGKHGGAQQMVVNALSTHVGMRMGEVLSAGGTGV